MEIALYIIFSIIAILGVIIELNTVAQVGTGMVVASFITFIVIGVTDADPVWISIVTFFGSWSLTWIVLFLLLRNRNIFHDKHDGYLAWHGMLVRATEGNQDGYGQIKINDKVFRFKSEDKIKRNDLVIIDKLEGVTMLVRKEK